MISGSAGLLFDNHTPVDSLRFCQKLHNVIDTLQNKAKHLMAQETNAKTLVPIFFWINSRMRRTRKYSSRDLNRQEKWAHKNLVTFGHVKCKVLHLGQNNPRHQYIPGLIGWKIALQRRNWTLVALVHTHTQNFNISQHRKQHCQHIEGGDPSSLPSPGGTIHLKDQTQRWQTWMHWREARERQRRWLRDWSIWRARDAWESWDSAWSKGSSGWSHHL